MTPLISLVIPFYNAEKYIGRCLESILKQTYQSFEVILVNDCSTDNTVNIVKDYIQRDSRLFLLEHLENKGTALSREDGYRAAKGDYVFFLDSDDSISPDALSLLYKEANKTNADIVIGNHTIVSNMNQICRENTLRYGVDRISVFKSLLREECSHSLCGKLFRISLLSDYLYVTNFQHKNGEDAVLFYQIVQNADSFALIEDSIYFYYQDNIDSSHRNNSIASLEGMYYANYMIDSITSNYPELKVDRIRKMIFRHIRSIKAGYPKSVINKFEKKYSLQYFTYKNLRSCFSFRERYVLYKQILTSYTKSLVSTKIWTIKN